MDLILWRHAEAEDGFPDSTRKLTAKGEKQAEAMAAWLTERLPKECRVIVSPARRTQQTALALTDQFETVAEVAVGASVESLLNAAGWPDAKGAVLIVGHQPTLGEVAAYLLADSSLGWSVKKGAVWWLSSRQRGAGHETVLKAAISPEMV
ncbi:MAG: histidine phosphatase family protein [Sulfuricella sp.]|nr:histidine phosphatase family protein [Sulfuricella sp.]